jgi:peptide/nickel transport system substrate-binding protein
METTWRIHSGAQWHGGSPFTSDDVLFTAQVAQDRELPSFRDAAYASVESVVAPDPLTVVVTWKTLYINADQLFGNPLPRYLLAVPAREEKATFTELPYWNLSFVGTGPFQLKEWVPGIHVLLTANDAYPLGRPVIDELDVKFIPSSNTLITNLLAGDVELTLGQTLSFDQALEMRDRWQQGHVEVVPRPGWTVIYPQFTYTNPPAVADVRFRRALMHAIDRQEMVDTLVAGLSSVAHSLLPLGRPDYADIKARAPRYEYDPRMAAQMIEELGLVKGADGGWVDSAGKRLSVEVRTSGENDNNVKALHSVVDYWQRAGVAVDAVFVPSQQRDREYLATFPGFILSRHTADETYFVNFISAKVATRENSFTGGDTGYHNPEYDELYERYSRTIPLQERIEALGKLDYHLADQAVAMGLYYDNLVAVIGNRLTNVVVPQYYGTQFTWSAHLWDVSG